MKRRLIVLLLVGAAVLALVGCGGRSDSSAADMPPSPEYYMLLLNTEGKGEIAYVEEGNVLLFNDLFPKSSDQVSVNDQTVYTIGARAADGYEFSKWTLNGEDYSRESVINIQFDSDATLIAVFEFVPEE